MTLPTFYETIGEDRLRQLVDHFYDFVCKDHAISHLFTTDMAVVKDKQFSFLCQFLGGPQRYNKTYGPPKMRMRHLPHRITPEARDAWLACMKKAIDQLDLEDKLKAALYQCFPKLADHMVNTR